VGVLSAIGQLWDWKDEGGSISCNMPTDGHGAGDIIHRLIRIMGAQV